MNSLVKFLALLMSLFSLLVWFTVVTVMTVAWLGEFSGIGPGTLKWFLSLGIFVLFLISHGALGVVALTVLTLTLSLRENVET